MSAAYDSRPDTLEHISIVRSYIDQVTRDLTIRASQHDRSKLREPELSIFNKYTPKLKDSTYGSDEYKGFLKSMGNDLRHHYDANDHHPEHFTNGIHDMTIVQIIEMLCDWKAATLRHTNGDLAKSIKQNAERFGYGAEIEGLLLRTADSFGWLS